MSLESSPAAVAAPALGARRQVMELLRGFTIETTPGSAAKIPDYRAHLRPGTAIAVTFLPGSDFADTVSTASRLKAEGFRPMPHFAARSIPSRAALDDSLHRLQGEVGVEEVVALAGGVSKPLGCFTDSMQMLETGLFERHGIRRIGIAGHPEGSPDIPEQELARALAWKNDYAAGSAADFYIVTQFCFDAAPIVAWDRAIRAAGNRLPLHIGIPGIASLKTLINHAKACGVGPSMRFLTRQARNLGKLMALRAPDRLLLDLARYKAEEPGCGIAKLHIYPLGGLKKSAAWTYAVAEGDFEIDEAGAFRLLRELD